MKHCPNPDCRGLAKFGFVSEYNDSATECGDCQAALLHGPAPAPVDSEPLCEPEPVPEPEPNNEPEDRPDPDPNLELVPILVARDQAQLILIEEALDMAGIPYMAKGDHIQDLFGFGRITIVNPVSGPVEIYVTSKDVDVAQKAVAAILG